MYGRVGYPALGAVFRLTESALLAKLEKLVQTMPDLFALREAAGIYQLYLIGEVKPLDMLNAHYDHLTECVAV